MTRTPSRARAGTVVLLSLAAAACGGGRTRDVVPESKDVVVDAGAANGPPAAYEYVARRPAAVVGLAEARGIDASVARAAVERLADAVAACANDERRKGAPVRGAARVVAQIGDRGDVQAATVRVDPGAGTARDAVLCLLAPMKLLTFPEADGGPRGIAVEALWGEH